MTGRNGSNGGRIPGTVLVLSAFLGGITLVTFGVYRYVLESTGRAGDVAALVLGAVVLAVGISAYYASSQHRGITTSVVLALGPVTGFLVYLVGYHLVSPPSTDSPTWLIFLGFAGGVLAVGVAGHVVGRLVPPRG